VLPPAPDADDIEAATARIAAACVVTPLLQSAELNARVGGRVLLKAEGLQRTGSFKLRGAYNRLAQLTAAQRDAGVVAYSSGNHAQAVACAAALVGTTAVIVMPADAPVRKIARTRAYGADVVLYDRTREDRAAIAAGLAAARGLTLVPPFEDRDVIAGQGTLAREIARQARQAASAPDALLVCCSGGGLVAGCAIAMQALLPDCAVYAVEPAGFDDTARSLAAGQRLSNAADARSICDALLVTTPGALTFAINRDRLAGALVVTDTQVEAAMRFAFADLGLVVEPGGAVALAAVLTGSFDARGRTVAVTLTGRNVDAALFSRVLAEG
jgi:threonine dehydratase